MVKLTNEVNPQGFPFPFYTPLGESILHYHMKIVKPQVEPQWIVFCDILLNCLNLWYEAFLAVTTGTTEALMLKVLDVV